MYINGATIPTYSINNVFNVGNVYSGEAKYQQQLCTNNNAYSGFYQVTASTGHKFLFYLNATDTSTTSTMWYQPYYSNNTMYYIGCQLAFSSNWWNARVAQYSSTLSLVSYNIGIVRVDRITIPSLTTS